MEVKCGGPRRRGDPTSPDWERERNRNSQIGCPESFSGIRRTSETLVRSTLYRVRKLTDRDDE